MELPEPLPRALKNAAEARGGVSPALSLFALPGDGSIRTRRVAIFVADGVDGEPRPRLSRWARRLGAVPRYVGARLGAVETEDGETLHVEVTFETMPSVLFDAVAVLDGKEAAVRPRQCRTRRWSSSKISIATRNRS